MKDKFSLVAKPRQNDYLWSLAVLFVWGAIQLYFYIRYKEIVRGLFFIPLAVFGWCIIDYVRYRRRRGSGEPSSSAGKLRDQPSRK